MFLSITTANFRDLHNNLEYFPKIALHKCSAEKVLCPKMTNFKMYRTIILPVFLYGCKTCSLT